MLKDSSIAAFLLFFIEYTRFDERYAVSWADYKIQRDREWLDWVDELSLAPDKKDICLILLGVSQGFDEIETVQMILEFLKKRWLARDINEVELMNSFHALAYNYNDVEFEEYKPGFADWPSCLHSYADDYTNDLIPGERDKAEFEYTFDKAFDRFVIDQGVIAKLEWFNYSFDSRA